MKMDSHPFLLILKHLKINAKVEETTNAKIMRHASGK
jgi:hypothetical protein